MMKFLLAVTALCAYVASQNPDTVLSAVLVWAVFCLGVLMLVVLAMGLQSGRYTGSDIQSIVIVGLLVVGGLTAGSTCCGVLYLLIVVMGFSSAWDASLRRKKRKK